MGASAKTTQLQLRVSPAQKAAIQKAARGTGMDMSAYVLAQVLPAAPRRFGELTGACREAGAEKFALAELSRWLEGLSGPELREAIASPPAAPLTPYLSNYVAAVVEYACVRRGVRPPPWISLVAPLAEPVFGSSLASLRLHLLTHSPPPFRRRNIFIDSSIGSQV